jgi:hypothetical protein
VAFSRCSSRSKAASIRIVVTTHNRCYSKNNALSIAIESADSHLWHCIPGFPAEGLGTAGGAQDPRRWSGEPDAVTYSEMGWGCQPGVGLARDASKPYFDSAMDGIWLPDLSPCAGFGLDLCDEFLK